MSNDNAKGLDALKLISERLGSLFGEVESKMGEAMRNAADGRDPGDTETMKSFSIPTPSGPVKGAISYGFRSGPLAGSAMRPRAAGAGRPQPPRDHEVHKPAAARPAEREPAFDCFDEGDHLLVTVELPGIAENEIRLTFPQPDLLELATGGPQRFATRRQLPCAVDGAAFGRRFRNGILELTLRKT
jgi:HSP20 family molecular chaperone IbpA